VVAWGIARGQGGWTNDQPLYEYEDESPVIPIDIRLKLFNLSMAYTKARDYHNEVFKREYTRREHPNAAFARKWSTFVARWVGWNSYMDRYTLSVQTNASFITAGSKTINLEHSQLAGTTRMVLEGLVEAARDLTFYLEDDIVINKWEIFIKRLAQLEDALKDFD
jgi:hypothetical protein